MLDHPVAGVDEDPGEQKRPAVRMSVRMAPDFLGHLYRATGRAPRRSEWRSCVHCPGGTCMAESVYRVTELVGTSARVLGEGSPDRHRDRILIVARPAHRRGGQARSDRRERQGRAVPHPPQRLVQVRERVAALAPFLGHSSRRCPLIAPRRSCRRRSRLAAIAWPTRSSATASAGCCSCPGCSSRR